MRDVLKRLERLEQETVGRDHGIGQMVIRFIGSDGNGGALPWEPRWANCAGEKIQREDGESPEAFEDRAKVRFPEGLIFMGGGNV